MFGNVRTYEGCALFREAIAKHPKFRAWYDRMKLVVVKGPNATKLASKSTGKTLLTLKSLNEEDFKSIPFSSYKLEKKFDMEDTPEELLNENSNSKSQTLIFRILTVNYLIHVIAFTFASSMNK
jgi:hypothetical protein